MLHRVYYKGKGGKGGKGGKEGRREGGKLEKRGTRRREDRYTSLVAIPIFVLALCIA